MKYLDGKESIDIQTVQIEIPFTAEEAIEKIVSMQQSAFIGRMIEVLHHGVNEEGNMPEDIFFTETDVDFSRKDLVVPVGKSDRFGVINESLFWKLRKEVGKMRDEDFDRVINEGKFENIEEEEVFSLWNFRGSLVVLSMFYLTYSNLPSDLADQFHQDTVTVYEKELNTMVGFYRINPEKDVPINTYKGNSEKDVPVEFYDKVIERIKKVHERGLDLTEFYNKKNPLPYLFGWKSGRVTPEMERVLIIQEFVSMFGDDKAMKKYKKQVGLG